MTKLLNKVLVLGFVLAAGMVSSFVDASATGANTTVQVEILPGDICIAATGSFDFGDYTVTSAIQTVTGAFTDFFTVDDLKGTDSGYYTTLQLSGNLAGSGTNSISSGNVYAQVGSTGTTLLSGQANANVQVATGMLSFSALNNAVTFIKRDTATNNGVVGKYGALPTLRVDIPAYQAVGTYTATLVYTLYEN